MKVDIRKGRTEEVTIYCEYSNADYIKVQRCEGTCTLCILVEPNPAYLEEEMRIFASPDSLRTFAEALLIMADEAEQDAEDE